MSKLSKALIAAAGNSGGAGLTVEDVFSTYLYEGNGSTQTITNGIDLDGEGGLVWTKDRERTQSHALFDTERGVNQVLLSNSTALSQTIANSLTSFNSDGFTLGGSFNASGYDIASWTFRKAEKFFDVVTYTGNGVAGRTVSHNLGSVPACIIVKLTSGSGGWIVYHVGTDATNPEQKYLQLNSTNAVADQTWPWNDTAPTDTEFTVGTGGNINANGSTYVAYLFASDAGGFGDDGSESIIKCGSYGPGTETLDGPEVNLGFEPQWVLTKCYDNGGDWVLHDNMRGVVTNGDDKWLRPNTNGAELTSENIIFTSTGFKITSAYAYVNQSGYNYIYIAIRRPMKTPESGTEVFTAVSGTNTNPAYVANHTVDMTILKQTGGSNTSAQTRLQGSGRSLLVNNTIAEFDFSGIAFDYQKGAHDSGASSFFSWMFKRATGFFDVVAYTGTSTTTTRSHNLGAVPELIISKPRGPTYSGDWVVYHADIGINSKSFLNDSSGFSATTGIWGSSAPTTTTWTQKDSSIIVSGENGIAYLFATLAGVSKVGSYTGNGTSQTIDCGFSGGARFFLVKASSTTGDWHVFDTARGIVAGNDSYLELNTTNAEDTDEDAVDPVSSGVIVNETSGANINTSGVTYIYLAIS